jgi:hypothetical protein
MSKEETPEFIEWKKEVENTIPDMIKHKFDLGPTTCFFNEKNILMINIGGYEVSTRSKFRATAAMKDVFKWCCEAIDNNMANIKYHLICAMFD